MTHPAENEFAGIKKATERKENTQWNDNNDPITTSRTEINK